MFQVASSGVENRRPRNLFLAYNVWKYKSHWVPNQSCMVDDSSICCCIMKMQSIAILFHTHIQRSIIHNLCTCYRHMLIYLGRILSIYFYYIRHEPFLSVCEITRDPTLTTLFYGQIILQYIIDACYTDAQGCFNITECHVMILHYNTASMFFVTTADFWKPPRNWWNLLYQFLIVRSDDIQI